jgi:hypothetical protein
VNDYAHNCSNYALYVACCRPSMVCSRYVNSISKININWLHEAREGVMSPQVGKRKGVKVGCENNPMLRNFYIFIMCFI